MDRANLSKSLPTRRNSYLHLAISTQNDTVLLHSRTNDQWGRSDLVLDVQSPYRRDTVIIVTNYRCILFRRCRGGVVMPERLCRVLID